jgi:ChrR Cupin-like domain
MSFSVDGQRIRELLSLQALQGLEGDDQSHLLQAMDQSPALAEELGQWHQVVASLAYATPPIEIAASLRQTLLQQFCPDLLERSEHPLLSQLWQQIMEQSHPLPWQDYPAVPGLEVVVLSSDQEARRVRYLMRSGGAVTFPCHRHADYEEMIILEGDLSIDSASYGRGDRILLAAGSFHSPKSYHGCLIFVDTSLDNERL